MAVVDSPVGNGAQPALRAHAARNREHVVQVAKQQIAAGEVDLSMNTIARLAGVGVGTVYRHFPTRQALLEAAAGASFDELVRDVRAAAAESDPAVGFRRAIRQTLYRMLDDPGLAALLSSPQFITPETGERRAEFGVCFGQLLARAKLVKKRLNADDIRRLLAGTVVAVRSGPDRRADPERYLKVLLDGLRPRPR